MLFPLAALRLEINWNLQELFKWLKCWPTSPKMCNYLKFWLCARQTARVEQCLTLCSPILRSPVLDYISPSSLVSLVLSVIAIFFTSQTYMSHPFPLCSVLLRSVRWHLLSTSSCSELCKTNPRLRQLHLLAAHWAQSATASKCWKRVYNFPNDS